MREENLTRTAGLFSRYPVRTCRGRERRCVLCDLKIVKGESYHDGGGRRAHVKCVKRLIDVAVNSVGMLICSYLHLQKSIRQFPQPIRFKPFFCAFQIKYCRSDHAKTFHARPINSLRRRSITSGKHELATFVNR